MNLKETTKVNKNTLPFLSMPFAIAAVFVGLLVNVFTDNSREYSPIKTATSVYQNGNAGMMQYFFNARRNVKTNALDYQSMLAADIADRAMSSIQHSSHTPSTLPNFTWNSMGPTNIGGRTRAILIDNKDASHQTLFAGGVSGGIWKSTNGGATWDATASSLANSLNDTLSNINISSIAQDANGVLYIGTGEGFSSLSLAGQGFSTGILGGGIFKSADDGVTWTSLPSTVPTFNKDSVAWAYVNRIAIRPDNPKVIYAATNSGFYVSHNSGANWSYATISGTNTNLTGNSLDVKISGDGSIIVACIGGFGYYCYPQNAPDSNFIEMDSTAGYGRINLGDTAASRIEFAISPTNPNRIYASYIDNSGKFGPGATNSRVLMTTTAKTKGGYWHTIGPGGTTGFDPYGQATFNNAAGVPPANEAQFICGGATLWEWSGSSLTDTVGSWHPVTHALEYYQGDPLWINPGQNTILFDPNNPQTAYVTSSGGISKSTDFAINPSSPENSIANIVFQSINRNYNVTQYYSVCYSPQVNYGYNNAVNAEGLGIGGGTQDNGSPYINGNTQSYPYDGTDLTGGSGAGAVISSLNPNIAYFSIAGGYLERTGNLGVLSPPTLSYNRTIGLHIGGNIDSVYLLGGGCFVFPVALYENSYDTLNHDSLQFTATVNCPKDSTIWLTADNGPTSYPYVLPKAVTKGTTITVPNRVVSRVAVGFSPTKGGIWINGQGASNNTVTWIPIAGPLSTPTPFADAGKAPSVHCLAWSPDGDALYAGTEDGVLFRFTNINSIIANKYSSGALYSETNKTIMDTSNQVVSTNITFSGLNGRDILSITVDPQNKNNVLVTVGNYGDSSYVYYTNSALSATPAFVSVQGNLPYMPVYSSILDIRNANGTWSTNSAMIATEHGIYTTDDVTASNVVWRKNNSGMANSLTLAVQQQTREPWQCNNTGDIYVATHGRGLWVASNNYNATTSVPEIAPPVTLNSLLLYPNPVTSQATIEYTLAAADNVTITIYDINGRQVKTINAGQQSPGSHMLTFESAGFSAGTYFASLAGSNFKKVSKFVVVK